MIAAIRDNTKLKKNTSILISGSLCNAINCYVISTYCHHYNCNNYAWPVIRVGRNISGIAVSRFASVIGTITAHGQDVQISEPHIDTTNKSLSMMVSAPDGGQVTLSIPRGMLSLIGDEQRQQQRIVN
jgi:hypothetical protein